MLCPPSLCLLGEPRLIQEQWPQSHMPQNTHYCKDVLGGIELISWFRQGTSRHGKSYGHECAISYRNLRRELQTWQGRLDEPMHQVVVKVGSRYWKF
jgi:hypothetical protein